MNRQEALYWCVEKYLQWPVGDTYYHAPAGWKWRRDLDQISLVEGSGILVVINEKDWLEAKAAKESEKWTPEFGSECEFRSVGRTLSESKWKGCLIIGKNSKGEYVIELLDSGEIDIESNPRFRPLRTQEEIDREELINSGSLIIEMANGSAGNAYKKYVTSLVDAGWRPTK